MGGSYQLILGACAIGAFHRSMPQIDTATGAGLYNGDASWVTDPLHGWEVGEDVPERPAPIHTPCRKTMGQNTDKAGSFGDSFVNINIQVFALALRG